MAQTRLACFFTVICAVASTATADLAPGDDVATDMINRLDTLVLPLINESSLNDTSLVKSLLTNLATRAQAASDKKAAIEAPDTALDVCLLLENGTLHAWKVCNATRASQKTLMEDHCTNAKDNGVGSYTIEKDVYKVGGGAVPRATCNFEDYTLDGNDDGCESFVDDITGDAKTAFEGQYATYTAAANECSDSTTTYENTVLNCSDLGRTHRDREATCVEKDTDLKVKVCSFQGALKLKCTTLSQVNTAIADLATQEENRNKELRTVMLTRCLFDKYKTQGETCFKTTVLNGCEKMVNGASEEYATTAAEKIHGFRTTAKTHIEVLPCEAQTITIGSNGLSYEKLDTNDDFSYYGKQAARTYEASSVGALTPDACES